MQHAHAHPFDFANSGRGPAATRKRPRATCERKKLTEVHMPFPKWQTRLRFHLRIRAARKRWCTSPPAPPATSLEHASMRPIRSNPPCPPHPASRLAEQRVERGIKASHRSEPGRRSTCEPNGGAAVRMCGGKRARTCATPAQLRASERETPFFGHFVFSLLNSATCASSDVLLMNVNVRVSISHTNAWDPSHSAGRSSTHARNRTSKHERTCCCSKEPCTTARRERLAGWHGSAAWLAEDERYRASV